MSEYKTIGDYAEAFSGYAFSSEDLVEDGVPVIKIGNIQNGIVVKECDSCYQKEITGKLKRYILDSDDFLIAMTGAGSVGRAGKMRGSTETVYLVNQRVAIVRTRDNANPDYLFYYFSMPYVERYLYSLGIGAGQPNISAKDILKTKVAFPDKNVQDKIADILVKYDELIDCNKLRIKILEQMAENLYKEWFVRFRFPKHDTIEFDNGIPKGWEIKRIGDVSRLVNGRAYLMPELQDDGKYRIVRVGNFSGKNEWFYSDMELDEDKYCEKGDLLYKWACNFGPEIWNEEKVIYHYHIWKIIPNEQVNREYLYHFLNYSTPLWLGGTNGATMVHITKESMEKKKILVPSEDLMIEFGRIVGDITHRIQLLKEQNKNLTEQRDLLLPRLMSGKLQVK